MEMCVFGAGNMGGAVARGLLKHNVIDASDMAIVNPSNRADAIKADYPELTVAHQAGDLAVKARYIFIAVKPWILKSVIDEIREDFRDDQTVVSVVAGVSCSEIAEMLGKPEAKVIRLIPNTAISVGESMTFVAGSVSAYEETKEIASMMSVLGKSLIIEERLMGAATALASCGIAYAFRYIRAASEGGCELGFYADQAKDIVCQTLKGAIAMIEHNGSNPETEIDKVTTPGGLTIKGLNAMEKNGFSASVIEGLKASVK